ncbi:acetyl-CoA carboxylase carboxyltransferase subunit beta [Lapidilactobacillus mulanensis]|uniref:acetyl-CoA carboxylase carboxyltransferase subunit beta n=1 Tax=Lapidilactobacillus mulanensis TaxID=2485999 RepID=UPI0013DDC7EC|nr:acetyl-CoA carboxylase carboxyltransferase subunit beta [Lapidilactobacillus mulanensis]
MVDKFIVGTYKVCPFCGYAFRIGAQERLQQLGGIFVEWNSKIKLKETFNSTKEYEEKLKSSRKRLTMNDSIITGEITFESNLKVAVGIFDYRFIMGSIGIVIGEKIKLLFEKAGQERLPVILFCASGGARMQESPFSLIQMEKMSYYAKIFKKQGNCLITVMCDPCMGGMLASIASIGNFCISEPKAQIGFAGLKVIEQTVGKKLDLNDQLAENVYRNGFLDDIVKREDITNWIERVSTMLKIGGTSNE